MKARILAALALAGFAGGCGFHPLYGDSGATAGTKDKLAAIYVDPIPNRLGYELRNELIDLFDSSGRASHDSYRLRVTIGEKSEGVALQNDVIEWCRDHRCHHKWTDTDADPHNM